MANDAVKDEIDAQSGRFEFLKQALTLGLAGLAGTAAFFTDTSKIPDNGWSVFAIIVMGLALLATVAVSLMGISVYANLLKAHSAGEAVDDFRKSMIGHAKLVFLSIAVVAGAFVSYGAFQIFHRQKQAITSIEAIGVARKAVVTGGCDAKFEALTQRNGSIVTFDAQECHRRYTVAVQRDGQVSSISSIQTP